MLAEHPHKRSADLFGQIRALVAGKRDVIGNTWLRTEELRVHVLPGEAGRPNAKQADQRGVQIAVPARHTELTEITLRELIGIECAHTNPSVAPTFLGQQKHGVARKRRYRVGEYLADIGSGIQRKALRQTGVGDVVLRGHASPNAVVVPYERSSVTIATQQADDTNRLVADRRAGLSRGLPTEAPVAVLIAD